MHIITALVAQKKRSWRTSIFIDGEFWRAYNTDTVAELGLHEGQHFDAKELERITYDLEKRRAIDRAVLLLSYRARSSQELSDRLRRAEFSQTIVTDALRDLKRLGYIDDEAFAHAWATSRVSSKLYGSKRIKQELKGKGISDDIIEEKLAEIASPENERERARKLAVRKLPGLKGIDSKTAFRRLSQMLLRHGFGASIAYEVCREVLTAEDFDDEQ